MTNSGGMYGSFSLVWKIFLLVVILLIVSFGFGYCKGYDAGKNSVNGGSIEKTKGKGVDIDLTPKKPCDPVTLENCEGK